MIITIFGKKGSGKSTLSKHDMVQFPGRIVFLSPVENLKVKDYVIWDNDELSYKMPLMKSGEIMIVRRADIESLDIICCIAMIEGHYTIVIDEIDQYKSSIQLRDMIHYARHFDINIISNTRRYVDVPRLLTSQSDLLKIFQTVEPRDLQYLKEYTGSDVINTISHLNPYTYLEYPSLEIRHTIKIL